MRRKAKSSASLCWARWPSGCVWCVVTWPQVTTTAWPPARPARPSSRGPSRVKETHTDTHTKHTFTHRNLLCFILSNRIYCA